jgi:hypothetical protein
VGDVEIWFVQELYWFLRSNAEIERFLSCRKVALSETDFFNRIGQKQSLGVLTNSGAIHTFVSLLLARIKM